MQSSSARQDTLRKPLSPTTVQLGKAHRHLLYAGFTLLTISGLAWVLGHYGLRSDSDMPHWLEAWSMNVYGAAAMLAWRLRRNLGGGGTLGGALVILTVTGYGLYYFAGEATRPVWSLVHWGIEIVVPTMVALHVHCGRRTRLHAIDGTAASAGRLSSRGDTDN